MNQVWDIVGAASIGAFLGIVALYLLFILFRARLEVKLRDFYREHASLEVASDEIDREVERLKELSRIARELTEQEGQFTDALEQRVRKLQQMDLTPEDIGLLRAVQADLEQRQAAMRELERSMATVEAQRDRVQVRQVAVSEGLERLRTLAQQSRRYYRWLELLGGAWAPRSGGRK